MEIWLTFQIPAGYSESAVKKPLCGGRGASSFLLVRDTSQSASLTAAPSRRSDSRSLAGPPIAPLPRNRLAFSAAGGASPVSPSRGAFLLCTPSMPPLEGRCRHRRRRGGSAFTIVKRLSIIITKSSFPSVDFSFIINKLLK